MLRYGSDKPDLRFGLEVADVTDLVAESGFRGFREAGRLTSVGWKHGRWLDSLYMQLELPLAPD